MCAGNPRIASYAKQGVLCWSGNDDEAHAGRHEFGGQGVISVSRLLLLRKESIRFRWRIGRIRRSGGHLGELSVEREGGGRVRVVVFFGGGNGIYFMHAGAPFLVMQVASSLTWPLLQASSCRAKTSSTPARPSPPSAAGHQQLDSWAVLQADAAARRRHRGLTAEPHQVAVLRAQPHPAVSAGLWLDASL